MDYGAVADVEEESQPLVGHFTRPPRDSAKQSWSKDPRFVALVLMVGLALFLIIATNNMRLLQEQIVPILNRSKPANARRL